MSAVVWGSGQVLNRQWIKGIIFFAIQVSLVCVELFTGTLRVLTAQPGATDIGGNPLLHFRNTGFFSNGIWGITTLGEIERTSSAVRVFDHSTMLMISGLLAIMVLLIALLIYVINIRDAYKTRIKIEAGEKVDNLSSLRDGLDNNFEYFSITPGLLLMIFVSLVPILASILVVFTNYNTNFIPPRHLIQWTGFETFRQIFTMPIWSRTLVWVFIWTTVWAFSATFSAYFAGMLQAVLLNSPLVKMKKIFRGIFMLPWAIPGFVSLLMFRSALNARGPLNQFLLDMGLIEQSIPFLTSADHARITLILVNVWLGFPYFMALISGVMATINTDMLEAASIDGANAPQTFRYITLPYIISATAPQIIFSITHNFNNFGVVYFLTQGGPATPNLQLAGSTDLLITWIFKLTYDHRMYNFAAAMSIFIFIVLATFSAINLRRTRVYREE
jgi:arabinogalactan oligomer/maltooligosaccharide transport system permease protein